MKMCFIPKYLHFLETNFRLLWKAFLWTLLWNRGEGQLRNRLILGLYLYTSLLLLLYLFTIIWFIIIILLLLLLFVISLLCKKNKRKNHNLHCITFQLKHLHVTCVVARNHGMPANPTQLSKNAVLHQPAVLNSATLPKQARINQPCLLRDVFLKTSALATISMNAKISNMLPRKPKSRV